MRVKNFKYLGQWIETNISEKEAFTSRLNTMERVYQRTKETYRKRSISINVKLTHYNTVIRPEALYAGECLTMAKKGLLEKLEVRKRKILRKILSAVKEGTEYRRRHNEELFKRTEKITDAIHKRRIAFYEHITGMDPKILTRRIFTYFLG